ncbi:hypothetical protein SODALDRAFT_327685 [Sodiomyces alkalinus F11]|uniref:VWFA domain-containing protein n=1 Tax=Sodiomyces alkalinus (strain CBS 110278 / VKM F-3762 / F11) TaxID=1314773 RepID=A0A3N2Q9R0_SODAK|nr:hypothetical protein SODALDRAFT_327685 [Sodiomyces alkalinus F11]ROT43491.1 hypothetical protein SODALDRAFT_327685 [Sodiomyces alkalinus F11]
MTGKSFFRSLKNKISPSHKSPMSSDAWGNDADMRHSDFGSRHVGSGTNPFSNPSLSVPAPSQLATEKPPAYSESPNDLRIGNSRGVSPTPSHISAGSLTTPEDPYAFLTTFDTIFVIDDSGSMSGRSWKEVADVLRTITPICTAHDTDGIDLFFLNHKSRSHALPSKGSAAGGYRGITDSATIQRLFASVHPTNGTPTGTCLQSILKPYLALCTEKKDVLETVKPVNVIVITDGVPSDDVESVLIAAAKKLDKLEAPPYQVGVQFFQVGNEPGAREALEQLDDGLSDLVDGGIRDIVDTVTWNTQKGVSRVLTADGILKTVLGAVVKRLDRQPVNAEASGRHLRP